MPSLSVVRMLSMYMQYPSPTEPRTIYVVLLILVYNLYQNDTAHVHVVKLQIWVFHIFRMVCPEGTSLREPLVCVSCNNAQNICACFIMHRSSLLL